MDKDSKKVVVIFNKKDRDLLKIEADKLSLPLSSYVRLIAIKSLNKGATD